MKIVNFKKIQKNIKGSKIPEPPSGIVSGHAAGELFEQHVYKDIKKCFPNETFRQYEYLNKLYGDNPDAIKWEARKNPFKSPVVRFLLSRGEDPTKKWSIENPFEEKQNDTADILVVKNNFYEIIDIKTRNISKKGQAPNIISALKVAKLCAKMIDNNEFDCFSITYFLTIFDGSDIIITL